MKLTVIMLNTWETRCRLQHENEWVPYGRRTVQIELSPDQQALLVGRVVGNDRGDEVRETIGQSWLEE